MPSSPSFSRRARPLCGTIFRLEAGAEGAHVDEAFFSAFALAASLEKIFSFFDPASELARLNALPARAEISVSPELAEVVALAFRLHRDSRGAFNPFFPEVFAEPPFALEGFALGKKKETRLDLNGIAKGYIADRLAELLAARLPETPGRVDAGGDLRFFGGAAPYSVHLRAGSPERAALVPLLSPLPAVASSGLADWHPSTRYGVPRGQSLLVAALAPSAALADAATKIALAAPPEVLAACERDWGFRTLAFDFEGRLLQNGSLHEALPAL